MVTAILEYFEDILAHFGGALPCLFKVGGALSSPPPLECIYNYVGKNIEANGQVTGHELKYRDNYLCSGVDQGHPERG